MMIANSAFAQPIVGVSDLKIGMTIEEFTDTREIKSKIIRDISTQSSDDRMDEYLERASNMVWKQDSESNVDSYSKIYAPGIIDYKFGIQLGIKKVTGDTFHVTTRFYENKLISIRIKNPGTELEELLEAKYGKPKIENKTNTVICQNGYGAKSEHLKGSVADVWGDGKPIKARIYSVFYDCGKAFSEYYIEDVKKVAAVNSIEEKAEQKQKNIERSIKASSSKL
jgi:hypothetical protein